MREQNLQPDAREVELLDRARAAADRIAELESLVAKHESTFIDTDGVYRPSPLLVEIRQSTTILTRCLNGIQMNPGPAKNPVKQRAGQASWVARSARDAMKQA